MTDEFLFQKRRKLSDLNVYTQLYIQQLISVFNSKYHYFQIGTPKFRYHI